jgi:hypothetical protein
LDPTIVMPHTPLVVVRENNTTMARELAALCPQLAPFDVARL